MNNYRATYKFKGWKYIHEPQNELKDSISIVPAEKKPIPPSLYKFYSLSSYNLEAMNNNYLYAAHPLELNDKFDCFKGFINYDSASEEQVKNFLKNFHSEKEIEERFLELKGLFKELFPFAMYSGTGIISFTSKILNPLMWAHYASANHGFAVRFNHRYFHEKVLGPFPINYQEEWELISLNNYMIAILYTTNIKSKKWLYEDEWRFIGSGQNMSWPRYREDKELVDNRKFSFQKEAIEEIILGNMFVDRINKYGENGTLVLALTPDAQYGEEKFDLMNFIVKNQIKTSRIVLKQGSFTFELDTTPVEIQKIDNYSFLMKI